jgi:hypothetical protein
MRAPQCKISFEASVFAIVASSLIFALFIYVCPPFIIESRSWNLFIISLKGSQGIAMKHPCVILIAQLKWGPHQATA